MTKTHIHTVAARTMSIALGVALALTLMPTAMAQEDEVAPQPRSERGPRANIDHGERGDRGERGPRGELSHEDRERMVKGRLSRMRESLQLTDEQVAALQPILAEESRKTLAIRQEYSGGQGNREGIRAKMQEVRSSTNKQVAAILDEKQFERYTTQQQRRRGPRGEGGPPRGGQGEFQTDERPRGPGRGPREGGPERGNRPPPPPPPGPDNDPEL